ncbi:MAG: TIGR03087 family PEP-CTERM/XrtA system glycosyltransferase [Pseudomonadota bacterium]
MLKPRYSCLFLANRVPYPADRGDKLRALAWLRRLSLHYDVTLLAGVDTVEDWRWREPLEDIAMEVRLTPAGGLRGKMRGAPQLIQGKPLTPAYFRNPETARKLQEETHEKRYDLVFVYTSGAAAYLDDLRTPPRATIVDFVDVDSARWEALSHAQSGPMSWIYAREGAALKIFEAELARRADVSLFATEAEAALFSARSGVSQGVRVLGNGVDVAYWGAAAEQPSPYADDKPTLVITGSMDQTPNVDAALWLHDQVLPLIRREEPETRFVVAGARPAPELTALASRMNVVTGDVDDLRPYLGHATVAAAPMRVARGIQNKVLEAMAAGAPLLASPQAVSGLDLRAGDHVSIADGADAFAAEALRLLRSPKTRETIAKAAQAHVAEHYDWAGKHDVLDHLAHTLLAGDGPEAGDETPDAADPTKVNAD